MESIFLSSKWNTEQKWTNWQPNIGKPASIWEHSRTSVASGRVSHHQCCRALCLWPVSASVRPQRRSPPAPVRPQRDPCWCWTTVLLSLKLLLLFGRPLAHHQSLTLWATAGEEDEIAFVGNGEERHVDSRMDCRCVTNNSNTLLHIRV